MSLFVAASTFAGIARGVDPEIETIAGTLLNQHGGDGLLATDPAVGIVFPPDVAVDGAGNIYITDKANRVRFIGSDGRIFTIAGNGVAGIGVDGVNATSTRVWDPRGLAIRGDQLYIVEWPPSRVRRVDLTTGQISTYAGFAGSGGFAGDGGPATSALLKNPSGVATNAAGDVFVADTGNNRIRKVTPAGIISTYAGTGTAGYNGDNQLATQAHLNRPEKIAVDAQGNLFIADTLNHRIRKVNTAGMISTVAGNGDQLFSALEAAATSSPICGPRGVDVDAAGNLYLSEGCSHHIRRVDGALGTLTRVAGFVDSVGNAVQGFNGTGDIPATEAMLNYPGNVRLDGAGRLLFTDENNHRVRRVQVAAAPPPPPPVGDADGDGVPDAVDNCPVTVNPDQANHDSDALGDACDPDDDDDTVADPADNCRIVANRDQNDLDGDSQGDACDADRDGDGVPNASDNCPDHPNAGQQDQDGDGLGDACDTNGTVKKVSPVLECVEHILGGGYTARFGYSNGNPQSIQIPAGTKNRFTPTPIDRGQPQTFLPGRRRNVFEVFFTGGNLVWTLDGKTSTASANPAQKCACVPNEGQVCGCFDSGVIRCDGTCSGALPPPNTPKCDACGGEIECNGLCSVPLPVDLGELCCSGYGLVMCSGDCSHPCL